MDKVMNYSKIALFALLVLIHLYLIITKLVFYRTRNEEYKVGEIVEVTVLTLSLFISGFIYSMKTIDKMARVAGLHKRWPNKNYPIQKATESHGPETEGDMDQEGNMADLPGTHMRSRNSYKSAKSEPNYYD